MSQDANDAGSVAKGDFLPIAATNWPTPRTEAGANHAGAMDPLPHVSELWNTPNVPNRGAEIAESKATRPDAGGEFAKMVVGWDHPWTASPGQLPYQEPRYVPTRKGDKLRLETSKEYWRRQEEYLESHPEERARLEAHVGTWPTPNAADHKTSPDYPHKGGNPTLVMESAAFPSFAPAPANSTSGEPSSPSGPTSPRRLNPAFVEWLQNWPPRWSTVPTDSECSATELTQWQQRWRSYIASLLS